MFERMNVFTRYTIINTYILLLREALAKALPLFHLHYMTAISGFTG